MVKEVKKAIEKLFSRQFGEYPEHISNLPHSGSERQYYRLKGATNCAIGVYNPDRKENKTFLYMTRFFLEENIPVPQIYQYDHSKNIYLLQDLGDQTLFSIITDRQKAPVDEKGLTVLLKNVIKELVRIQIVAGKKFDFSKCYPYKEFNRSSIIYDLEYFREQFLERINLQYNKKQLQVDFRKLTDFINTADKEYFMYRDFQSRNIMVHNERLYFIDYQGGRKGPLQYDLASLLFQARARIPEHIREDVLEYYISLARMLTPVSRDEFLQHYYAIALIRVLQTLGAYGLKGLKEQKEHFIQSIPFALGNLDMISEKNIILGQLPELNRIISILQNLNLSNNGIKQKT